MMNCPEDMHDIQTDRVIASSTVIAPRRVPRPVMSSVFGSAKRGRGRPRVQRRDSHSPPTAKTKRGRGKPKKNAWMFS